MEAENKKYTTLTITMNDGELVRYSEGYWDDYSVVLGTNVPSIVVKHKGAWIGIIP